MDDERRIQQVLARYVRAADHRDGVAMSALFTTEARLVLSQREPGGPRVIAELEGADAIGAAVSGLMAPHPPRGWSHHTTSDHIIEVDGDSATLDAQFVVFSTVGTEPPVDGWPAGSSGAQGVIAPTESGYYRPTLVRTGEGWLIRHHEILMDQPLALPGA